MSLLKPLVTLEGLAVPLDRINVDTDAIIPKQFLRSIKRTGFGPYLFHAWRYEVPENNEAASGMATANLQPDREFVLNQSRYAGASILLTRDNFGCGSSREHAVWALRDFGIRVLVGTTFADIFYNNCLNNGLLPIRLDEKVLETWFHRAREPMRLLVDLPAQTVGCAGEPAHFFQIDPYYKQRLLEGADQITLTLRHKDDIERFEKLHRANRPWIFSG